MSQGEFVAGFKRAPAKRFASILTPARTAGAKQTPCLTDQMSLLGWKGTFLVYFNLCACLPAAAASPCCACMRTSSSSLSSSQAELWAEKLWLLSQLLLCTTFCSLSHYSHKLISTAPARWHRSATGCNNMRQIGKRLRRQQAGMAAVASDDGYASQWSRLLEIKWKRNRLLWMRWHTACWRFFLPGDFFHKH